MMDTWGLYPWFEEQGEDCIHADDRAAFRALGAYGKVFVCEAANEYLVLRYGDHSYRVRPSLFQPVLAPAFGFGDRVRTVEKGREGTVQDIQWHHARREPMFFLRVDGKRLGRRYWTTDLQPA